MNKEPKKKVAKSAQQWMVLRGVHIDSLESELNSWTEKRWQVHSIFGPHGCIAVVLHRLLVL